MKKAWIRLSAIFFLTFVFLFFFFRSVEWKEVFEYLTDIKPVYFVLLIVLVPMHLVTRALRWRYLLIHKKKNVKFFNMFAGNAVGFTVTLIFPGRLGELVKPLYLAKKEDMSKGFVIGTIVVERTFDMFTMSFLLGLFLVTKLPFSSTFPPKEGATHLLFKWGLVGVAFAFLLLILSLSFYFFKEKALSFIKFVLKPFPHGISRKILELSAEFIQGLKMFHSVGNLLMYTVLSLVVWLGIVFYYWILFFGYDISIPFHTVLPYTFLVMVGASIPTPGMVGGFHYFSKLGLISLFSLQDSKAAAMTIVVHAVQLIVTCLIGYAILWKEGISIFQLKKLGENAKK